MGLFDNKSSNPMFNKDILDSYTGEHSDKMTVNGTVTKTLILLAIAVITAFASWKFMISLGGALKPVLFGSMIGAVALYYMSYKNPDRAPILAPITAVLQGLFLGVVSMMYASMIEGIIINATLLTFGTMFMMLFIYKTGLIKITDKFRMIMGMSIGAIGLLYLSSWVLGFFGIELGFLHDGSPLAIGISCVIIVVASLSFLLDFDMIEKQSANGAPKNFEWVGGMALLATIVWLYLEFLRLLSMLSGD